MSSALHVDVRAAVLDGRSTPRSFALGSRRAPRTLDVERDEGEDMDRWCPSEPPPGWPK